VSITTMRLRRSTGIGCRKMLFQICDSRMVSLRGIVRLILRRLYPQISQIYADKKTMVELLMQLPKPSAPVIHLRLSASSADNVFPYTGMKLDGSLHAPISSWNVRLLSTSICPSSASRIA
jgi:hypothetical protein